MVERALGHMDQTGGVMPTSLWRMLMDQVNEDQDAPKTERDVVIPVELVFFLPLLVTTVNSLLRQDAQHQAYTSSPQASAKFRYVETLASRVGGLEAFGYKPKKKAYVFSVDLADSSAELAVDIATQVDAIRARSKRAKKLRNCDFKSMISVNPNGTIIRLEFAFVQHDQPMTRPGSGETSNLADLGQDVDGNLD